MASGKKRTSCAKAPTNRSARIATVARELYPMMMMMMMMMKIIELMRDEKQVAVFATDCFMRVD